MSGFSDSEKIDLLIKKFFGKPSTSTSLQFFQEAGLDSRPSVFQDQIYQDTIPATAPNDIKTATQDDDGASITGSVKGKTSSSNPMVRKYVKVQLVKITNGLNSSLMWFFQRSDIYLKNQWILRVSSAKAHSC